MRGKSSGVKQKVMRQMPHTISTVRQKTALCETGLMAFSLISRWHTLYTNKTKFQIKLKRFRIINPAKDRAVRN